MDPGDGQRIIDCIIISKKKTEIGVEVYRVFGLNLPDLALENIEKQVIACCFAFCVQDQSIWMNGLKSQFYHSFSWIAFKSFQLVCDKFASVKSSFYRLRYRGKPQENESDCETACQIHHSSAKTPKEAPLKIQGQF